MSTQTQSQFSKIGHLIAWNLGLHIVFLASIYLGSLGQYQPPRVVSTLHIRGFPCPCCYITSCHSEMEYSYRVTLFYSKDFGCSKWKFLGERSTGIVFTDRNLFQWLISLWMALYDNRQEGAEMHLHSVIPGSIWYCRWSDIYWTMGLNNYSDSYCSIDLSISKLLEAIFFCLWLRCCILTLVLQYFPKSLVYKWSCTADTFFKTVKLHNLQHHAIWEL